MNRPEEIWEMKPLAKTFGLPLRVKAKCLTSAEKITRTYYPPESVTIDNWEDWVYVMMQETREVVRLRGRDGMWYFLTAIKPSTGEAQPQSTILNALATDPIEGIADTLQVQVDTDIAPPQ